MKKTKGKILSLFLTAVLLLGILPAGQAVYADDDHTPTLTRPGICINGTLYNGSHYQGGGRYGEGTEITVSAVAKEGYSFTHWEDPSLGKVLSTNASYTFTVYSDITLRAVFSEVRPGPKPGFTVTLTAEPLEAEIFVRGIRLRGQDHDIFPEDGG